MMCVLLWLKVLSLGFEAGRFQAFAVNGGVHVEGWCVCVCVCVCVYVCEWMRGV